MAVIFHGCPPVATPKTPGRDIATKSWKPRPLSRDAVLFAQMSLKNLPLAWQLAHSLGLDDDRTWADLVKAYELDPLAVLPVLTRRVENDLIEGDASNYRLRRLSKMRKLAADSGYAV
ncbi:MAG: hypothetical protein WCG47_30200 [Dermatophilaceae bacterium]